MRPTLALQDLPTTHDVVNHLHNEFAKWVSQLKDDIEVSEFYASKSQGIPKLRIDGSRTDLHNSRYVDS